MTASLTHVADYAEARQYLEAFVQTTGLAATPQNALQRAKALMELLGDPQNNVPVIHLAGTSGKGSTATILAALLQAHGLRAGLGLSPHVRHLLERIQLDGEPVPEALFCHTLQIMIPAIEQMQTSAWGAPSFFEIFIALTYKLFADLPVDVIVMETGLGGRYDATNTVTNPTKLTLFTDISYDHVDILGNTLEKIAAQKAGIIQPHNSVLTYQQAEPAQEIITAEAAAQAATLATFDPTASITNLELHPDHLLFDLCLSVMPAEQRDYRALRLSLTGEHQAQNAGLAIAAAQLFLHSIGRTLEERAIRHALAHVQLLGRMDQRSWRGVDFIIDGAHNPQKIHALCNALATLYPNQKFIFVIALKQGKDHHAILAQLVPLAKQIIITRFNNQDQGMPLEPTNPYELAMHIPTDSNVQISIVPTAAEAINLSAVSARAMNGLAGTEFAQPTPVVVTGSLYLLAEVYEVIDRQG